MTFSRRSLLITAGLAVVVLAVLVLMVTRGGLSAADRRIVDRMEDAFEPCYADDLHTLDRVAGCMEGKRLRLQLEARGLCRDLRGEDNGYRGMVRCDG